VVTPDRALVPGRDPRECGFTELLGDLLEETSAARVTLRIDAPDHGVGVDAPVVEACRPGMQSLMGVSGINQRAAATVHWLERERRILVQPDFTAADPRPPQALIDGYGVTAQMLAPLFDGDSLVGWISVHAVGGRRDWGAADVEALRRAALEVAIRLGLDGDRSAQG